MAGSITDMNRDSLASVSSSQDVHICCMTSSIDPVCCRLQSSLSTSLKNIGVQQCLRKCLAVRYIFTAVIYFRIKDRIVYESLCQIKTTVCVEPA